MTSAVEEKKAPDHGGPPTDAPAPAAQVPPKRRRGRVVLGILVLLTVAAGVFGYWYFFMKGIVYTDDARLAGHLVDLAPEISGRLTELTVQEGQSVHKGDVIFTLSASTYRAEVDQAQAAVVSAKAGLQVAQATLERTLNGSRPEEIAAAQATLKRLDAEQELAKVEYERAQRLDAKGVNARDQLDRARTAYESAQHNRENAAQTLSMLKEGARVEDIDAAKAQVAVAKSKVVEAQAALEKARSDLAHCTVAAPFDGWVVRRWLEPGAMPLPGQPVVTLFDPSSLRVDANIEEKYLSDVAVGDPAGIEVDAYPDLHLQGRVARILRATNSQFSLVPAEGVSGTHIKVSQRVPLRIDLIDPPHCLLAPGLSVEVRVHVGKREAGAGRLEAGGTAAEKSEIRNPKSEGNPKPEIRNANNSPAAEVSSASSAPSASSSAAVPKTQGPKPEAASSAVPTSSRLRSPASAPRGDGS